MSQLQRDMIRSWGLAFSDAYSTAFKMGLECLDLTCVEMNYHDFLSGNRPPKWAILCHEHTQPLVICLDYSAITASTHYMVSNQKITETNRLELTPSETFVAGELSTLAVDTLTQPPLSIQFSRSEPDLSLIRPFHNDERITIYNYKLMINKQHVGGMYLCHTHVL